MDHYWDALQERVCRKCMDGDGRGHCRLSREQSCTLHEFHPEVFALIGSLRETTYEPYVQALRQKICSACTRQEEDGTCRQRESLECPLDRYYPLVIEVAERVLTDEYLFSRPEATLEA